MYRVLNNGYSLQVRELRGGDIIRSHPAAHVNLVDSDHAALWTVGHDLHLYTDIFGDGRHIGPVERIYYNISFRVQDALMRSVECIDDWEYLRPATQGWCVSTKFYRVPRRVTGGTRMRCRSAIYNGHTYVISRHYAWEEQSRESRDFCTLVTLPIRSVDNVHIATGDGCLFLIGNGGRKISSFDPRDPAEQSVLYVSEDPRDDMGYFRDVPNGIMITQTLLTTFPRPVELFDHRSCAMIGTDIFLGYNEYLFCLPHSRNTIEIAPSYATLNVPCSQRRQRPTSARTARRRHHTQPSD
jgi:hypothetical protein